MKTPSRFVMTATLGLLSLIWGTTWAAVRIGLRGIPPFTGVALRFGIAAVALFVLGRIRGIRLGGTRRERWLWVVNGVLSFCGSYGIVYWSEQWVPSGLAAVLFATFPFFVALLAHYALPNEPLRSGTVAGVVVGFAGVALIFSEDFTKLGGPGVALGAAVMLVSPLVSAVASVAIKRWGKGLHHLSLTTVPMAIAAGVMGAAAAGWERDRPIVWNRASIAALLYLALAGSAVTFSLYYWLLEHLPATRVSLIAYTTPVVAVTVGAIFMDEPYTLRTLAGSALVLVGVAASVGPFPRLRARGAIPLLLLALASRAGAAEAGPLRLPSDPPPASVQALGALDGLLALTLTEDSEGAAAAIAAGTETKDRTLIRAAGAPAGREPRETRIDGVVRALRFGPGGQVLYALIVQLPTRRNSGTAELVSYDPATLRETRSVRVPLTARAIDLTADGIALLVAGHDELRVFLVPDLRSPQLYGLPGDNLSIAVLPGGDRVLVGQKAALVLVDLSDRQTREGLPPREQVAVDCPVVSLAASPDAASALARCQDGRTLRVAFEPLRVEPAGVSAAIAWPGARIHYRASLPKAIEEPAVPPPVPATTSPETPPAPPQQPDTPEPPPPAAPVEPPPSAIPPPAANPPAETAKPPAEELSGFVRGRVTGPARDAVRHVVLYGPDNLVHEAARVVPGADGSWSAGPLAPGSYRVVLDPGGTRTLLSEPPFGRVVLRDGAGAQAPDLVAVRVMTL